MKEGTKLVGKMLSLTSTPLSGRRMRTAVNALRVAAVALFVAAVYRHRRGIRRTLTGGFGTVRRTASNLNDLLFSSSSLATAFAKDLRTFLFTDSGHTPTSLHRLIGLLCSDEVQRSIQGTSQTLLAAFFAARRKEAEERKLRGEAIADGDSFLRISDAILTKMLTPAGHEFVDHTLKSAAASFLSIYLSLPKQPTTDTTRNHFTPLELTGTILDKLASPQGRQLVVAAVGAFTSAATPIIVSELCSKNHQSCEQASSPASQTGSHAHRPPHVVEIVLEWLTHPASRDQAEALLSSVASKTAAAAVNAAMHHSSPESQRKFSFSHSVDEEDKHMMLQRHRPEKAHSNTELEHHGALSASRDDHASCLEGEQNPPRQMRDNCNSGHKAWDWGGATATPVEWCCAIAQRPACRALVCEVAGSCVREGVLAFMAGIRGPPGGSQQAGHVLLTASWEALALLGALTLMAGLAQGAALTLCVLVLSGWCLALLMGGTPLPDHVKRAAKTSSVSRSVAAQGATTSNDDRTSSENVRSNLVGAPLALAAAPKAIGER